MTEMVPAHPQMVSQAQRELDEWNEASSTAAEVLGYSLYGGKENDRKLDALVGVPFVITGISFREGDIIPALGTLLPDGTRDKESPRDYVSLECLIHPDYAPTFKRKYIVFNDGSTGIYRQIVAFLASRGEFPLNESLPESGDANTTRYDISLSHGPDEPEEFKGNLRCPEGLRKSEYKGPAGDSVTWYLA